MQTTYVSLNVNKYASKYDRDALETAAFNTLE